ncbi:MAG: DUF447 domain-containing protein [Promethearchaeota archaeon]|jgi:hypothetical protein
MSFDPKIFGLKKDYLYEVIATSFSIANDGTAIKPNASCMGIRLVENNKIQITPYSTSSTYRNLKDNSIIALNFIDDVYLYALAALKDPNSPINLVEFPSENYAFKSLESLSMDVPYIKNSWAILICKVFKEFEEVKTGDLGEIMIPRFILDVISGELFQASHKLFNRAENLALEAIISTTRLKIAKDNKNKLLFSEILDKINEDIKNIIRFGKNKKAIKTIELVTNYINSLKL